MFALHEHYLPPFLGALIFCSHRPTEKHIYIDACVVRSPLRHLFTLVCGVPHYLTCMRQVDFDSVHVYISMTCKYCGQCGTHSCSIYVLIRFSYNTPINLYAGKQIAVSSCPFFRKAESIIQNPLFSQTF